MLLSVILMVLDHHYHKLDSARIFLSQAVFPIQWAIEVPFKSARWVAEATHTHRGLMGEINRLREQYFLQEARIQRLSALEAENAQLRALLQASPRAGHQLKAAEILQVDEDPFNHRILLNKGRSDGVSIGQPLIDDKGIVGEVVEVFDYTSRALLVTDASHAIPVENVRNGVRGIILGTGSIDSLQLQYVPTTADIQQGDDLVTSGLGGRFPPGYPVGQVVNVSKDAGESFAVIRAKPKAHLNRGRQVLLIMDEITQEDKILDEKKATESIEIEKKDEQ